MLSRALAVLCVVNIASSRDMKPLPSISNSVVNFGKMEFSFNLKDVPHNKNREAQQRTMPVESCPCKSRSNNKDDVTNDALSFIHKIFSPNDFLSIDKEPISSSSCCGSDETVQEKSIVIEIPPNETPLKPSTGNSFIPMLPFIYDTLFPKKNMPSNNVYEIVMYPDKKKQAPSDKMSPKNRPAIENNKKDIKVVGKELTNNNIELFKPPPPAPVSVKKDLNTQEQKEMEEEKEEAKVDAKKLLEPAADPNAI